MWGKLIILTLAVATCDQARQVWTSDEARPAADVGECAKDEDCVLLPSALTCCIECPPAPPFEAAPAWVLDGMLIQSETDCAAGDRPCPDVQCETVPPGCSARAACSDHKCVAVADGCIPIS